MRSFYTQNGWAGNRYEQSKELPLKEIAKKIKREILQKHPEIDVSVSTEHFSMGRAINIYVKSTPFKIFRKDQPQYPGDISLHYNEQAEALLKDIQAIADQYRYDDSDGMIDYFSTNFYCSPEFAYELRRKEEVELGIPQ